MLNICVCDNNELDLKIQRIFLKEISRELNINLNVKYFLKSNEIINYATANAIDIVLLEIDISRLNGIDIGKKLKCLNPYTEIIFFSSNKTFAVDAFGIGAAGYILKPIKYNDLVSIFKRVISIVKSYKEYVTTSLIFFVQRSKKVVSQKSIIYIEKYKNNCYIVTTEQTLTVYTSIKELIPKLEYYFWQINQGTIINSHYLSEIKKNEIILDSKNCFTVSRKYMKELKDKLKYFDLKNNT